MGTLERLEERLPEARDAYGQARPFAAGSRQGLQSLAGGYLEMGEAAPAVEILTALAGQDARDVETRRLLARALLAAGQPDQAVQSAGRGGGDGARRPGGRVPAGQRVPVAQEAGRRRPPVRARS